VLLAVSKADLLIENGGGYDDFMSQLIESAGTSAPLLNAVAVSGHRATAGAEVNEHVWYDLRSAERVADAIAARLAQLAPEHRAEFTANARAFSLRVDALVAQERRFAASHAGTGVGITEPVPLYMLRAMGLRNLTPAAFSSAVEEGSDVAARVLAETLDLYSTHRVAALVYNEQTSSTITEQVQSAAEAAGVPVVPVTETEPTGLDYQDWMQRNLRAIEQAVAGS
jgi:zinc/manganese transport system substrate-binding protein